VLLLSLGLNAKEGGGRTQRGDRHSPMNTRYSIKRPLTIYGWRSNLRGKNREQ